tara:strand:+ start:130 stop:411 length:282 start_codon:yes stop_codon:yes gene_type:complete
MQQKEFSKLDKELQEYYDNYFSLFQHAGWKQLMEDLEDTTESFDVLNLKDAKELHYAQGQLNILNTLLNWKDSMSNAYENIEQEESYQPTNLQ